jgi:hypothetical protein
LLKISDPAAFRKSFIRALTTFGNSFVSALSKRLN